MWRPAVALYKNVITQETVDCIFRWSWCNSQFALPSAAAYWVAGLNNSWLNAPIRCLLTTSWMQPPGCLCRLYSFSRELHFFYASLCQELQGDWKMFLDWEQMRPLVTLEWSAAYSPENQSSETLVPIVLM